LGQFYQRLSIPPNSLPLSTFPPSYNTTQEDLYRGHQINPRDFSQLNLDLIMQFSPPNPKEHTWTYDPHTFPSADSEIRIKNASHGKTTVSSLLEAFTKSADSEFSLTVTGTGKLSFFGPWHNETRNTPEVFQSLLNQTLDISGRLFSLAAWDLDALTISVNYLCIDTKKEWLPPLKAFSIIAGSSIGTFSAILTILLLVSRHLLV
jgi:hypothetical protein